MRRWKKIFHANGNQKKAAVAILISDNIDFKINTLTRDKEGHYIMIKESTQEEGITIVNIYAPRGGREDGGRVRRGDHLPSHNTVEIHLHVELLLQNTH